MSFNLWRRPQLLLWLRTDHNQGCLGQHEYTQGQRYKLCPIGVLALWDCCRCMIIKVTRSSKVESYISFIPFFFLGFWSFLATTVWKYHGIFVYILQGMMGKTGKNQNENHTTKVGNQKTIIWDEQNITVLRVAVIHATFSQYQQTPYQGI